MPISRVSRLDSQEDELLLCRCHSQAVRILCMHSRAINSPIPDNFLCRQSEKLIFLYLVAGRSLMNACTSQRSDSISTCSFQHQLDILLYQYQCVLHLAACGGSCICWQLVSWPLRTWEWMQFYSPTPQWSRVGCWPGPVGVSSVMTWQLSLKNWSRGMPPLLYVHTYMWVCVRVHVCVPIPSHMYICTLSCIHMYMYVICIYVCVGMRICTCNLRVMRAYFQNLKTYPSDSVVCCKWQTALQQSNSVAHICDPTRCRLIVLLAFCDVTSALHARP